MHWKIGLLGFVITLGGSALYMALLDIPWIRSTAAPNLALAAIGLAISIRVAVQHPGRATIALACAGGLIAVMFAVSMFVLVRLPGAKESQAGTTPPDFTLLNQDGEPVTLSSYRGRGPVLLVFYRGHW